ncbi:MAG: tetratricopeptide repeat protein [Gemmatimonadaceae bacterium]
MHNGQASLARDSEQRLRVLEKSAEQMSETLFARNIRILRLALSAWIASASGDAQTGVQHLRDAAELELQTPKHAVTPGPTIPAYELLGDLLARHGKHNEALIAYEQALAHYPGRFNSLIGAARSARETGVHEKARTFYEQLSGMADPKSRRTGLSEARQYLTQSPRTQ